MSHVKAEIILIAPENKKDIFFIKLSVNIFLTRRGWALGTRDEWITTSSKNSWSSEQKKKKKSRLWKVIILFVVVLKYDCKFFDIPAFKRFFSSLPLVWTILTDSLLINRIVMEMKNVWCPRVGHKRHWGFHLVLSRITHSGEGQVPWHKDTQVAHGEIHVTRNWSFLITDDKEQTALPTATWVSHLRIGNSYFSQALKCLQP